MPDWLFDENMVTESIMDLFESFHERKAQKGEIKEDLSPMAWHPDRAWDWCFNEEQKIRWLNSEMIYINGESYDASNV